MNNKVRAHIFISGRVQGVFFRDRTRRKVLQLGITGWVRNLADGRVEAVLEGEKEKVEEMLAWTKKGPFGVKVEEVEINWEQYQEEFTTFEIRY